MIFFWNILKGKSIDIQRHPRQKKVKADKYSNTKGSERLGRF